MTLSFYRNCGIVKQLGNILKVLSGFWDYGVIIVEEDRLCLQALRDQPERSSGSNAHKSWVIGLGIGAGIKKAFSD